MEEKIVRILVVEDDDLDRRIIRKALRDSGIPHELVIVEDHETGKEAAIGKEFECIFLDYHLPGGTGLELLKEIRDSGNTSPIIIVTSQRDVQIAVEAIKLGADDYIPKNLLSADGMAQSLRYAINMKEQAKRQRELENKLKETQKQLHAVVATAPIILFSIDENSNLLLFEGKGLESLGLSKDEVKIGTSLHELDLPVSAENYRQAMEGKEHTIVSEWKDQFFEVFYSPIRDDRRVTGVLGIISDITEHVRAERELKHAKKMAEETAQVKQQFLANMSHEIRTPMNGIVGLTRILANTPLDSEQNKYVQSIQNCSDNLLVIINDILDFSKIEAGKMTFERVAFKINETVSNTIELFQPKADEKSIQLILETDPAIPAWVHGDPTRLSQVMNNLVSNAIKFTEKGEVRVKLSLVSSGPDGLSIRFEVKDTGIGIPEKSLPNIFDSFTQASSDTTRKFGGTGLGLTIVKRLIELQEGGIEVKSKAGLGTTFQFTLPFEHSTNENPGQVTGDDESQSTAHLRILIAEDNKVNQLIVKKVFSMWGTNVDLADNGLIALEKLKANDYDIILMDMQMPEMDGYTAVQKIRAEFPEPKRSIPIMAMTAHAIATERQKCFDAGMNDYISKPFEPEDLRKKVLALTKQSAPPLKTQSKPEHVLINKQEPNRNAPGDGLLTAREITTPRINLSYLKLIADGNDTFIIEMIEMFLNKMPQALDQMNDYFQRKNWEELRKIAHKIKPSYAYIGLKEIQTALSEIEKLAEEGQDADTVKGLMQQVANGTTSAYDELRAELQSLK